MDYYKKKPLKFNSEVRREIRHAETVKARESSRFKRLSMLRCIEENEQSFEMPKKEACEVVKKPVSRLEILCKWKNEKIIKKELEKKNSIRPFYAGTSSLKSINKVSCISNQISRIPNSSKQMSFSSTTSRIPNSSKSLSTISKTIKNTQPQLQRIPSSNQEILKNPTAFVNKSKTNLLKSKSQIGTVPRTTKNIQPQLQRIPSSNLERKLTAFGKNPTTNQVQLKSKTQIDTSSSLNRSSSTKGFQSRIAKPVSVVPRIPAQSKLPVSNHQKPTATISKKLPSVKVLPVNTKKIPPVLRNQKQDKKNFCESTTNRSREPSNVQEIIPKEKEVKHTCSANYEQESSSDRNNDSLTDIFDCDVSVIKRAPSFAPDNFTFQPPSEILDFSFDYSILKKIKEFTSRTSTPSKKEVQRKKSDDDNKVIIQKPSENVDIETDISIPPKHPTQSLKGIVNDKSDEELMHIPSAYLDIETNISTPSKKEVQGKESDDDNKEKIQKPSENVDIETDISNLSKHPSQTLKVIVNDKYQGEIMHTPSEYLDNETNISTPKQLVYNNAKETMHEKTENVDIEGNISSPLEDLNGNSENSPPKINLQDSHKSSQPECLTKTETDMEILLEDWKKVVVETEKNIGLSLNEEANSEIYKEKYKDSFQNIYQKRRSILKKSSLNSIAETEDLPLLSSVKDATENKENVLCTMSRRSRRISKLISIDESPSTSPRCSLRLQKKLPKGIQPNSPNYKGISHTNLTNDFDRLTLQDFDEMNPDDYLCDPFDSPEVIHSKKISLLYSPEKRKSIRRSIRGDLMSFSPVKSPRV